MKNHIGLIKLRLKLSGYKITSDPFEVNKDSSYLISDYACNKFYKYFRNDLIIFYKKQERRIGIIDKTGRIIINCYMIKIIDVTPDTILIYDESDLTFKGISISQGNSTFTVKAYGKEEASFVELGHYNEDRYLSRGITYAILRDARNRYRVITEQGFEIESKLIDYKKVIDKNDNVIYLALRYEDGFGLLNDAGKVYKCNNISDLIRTDIDYSKPKTFLKAPVIIGRYYENENKSPDLNKDEYFSFAGLNGKVVDNYKIAHILNDGDKPCYLIKKYTLDALESSYNYINKYGSLIFENDLYEATPIVSNRAFIKSNASDKYWTLIDEDGRIINSTYKILKIISTFEKIKYGSFDMTLARVEEEKLGIIYIDKELHYYPDFKI